MATPKQKHHHSMDHARARKQTTKWKVDLTYLQDLADGDENFVNEVISMFLNDTPDILKQLMVYHKSGNTPLLKSSVHKLKSSLRMLGNDALGEIAQQLETQLAEDAANAQLPTILAGFVTKTSQFLDFLKLELDNRMVEGNSPS